MNVNSQKGIITELKCQYDFSRYGILLSQPIIPDSRYDFIADINGKLYKIQCKSSAIAEDRSFLRMKCTMNNIRNNTYTSYTSNDIDYFYTCYDNQSYLISPNIGGQKEKILRFSAKQNHDTIIWAKDYELEKILQNLGYDIENNQWTQTITKGKA